MRHERAATPIRKRSRASRATRATSSTVPERPERVGRKSRVGRRPMAWQRSRRGPPPRRVVVAAARKCGRPHLDGPLELFPLVLAGTLPEAAGPLADLIQSQAFPVPRKRIKVLLDLASRSSHKRPVPSCTAARRRHIVAAFSNRSGSKSPGDRCSPGEAPIHNEEASSTNPTLRSTGPYESSPGTWRPSAAVRAGAGRSASPMSRSSTRAERAAFRSVPCCSTQTSNGTAQWAIRSPSKWRRSENARVATSGTPSIRLLFSVSASAPAKSASETSP